MCKLVMVTVFNNENKPSDGKYNLKKYIYLKKWQFHCKNAVSMATDSQNATFYYLIKSIVSHLTVIHHQLVIVSSRMSGDTMV